MSEVRDRSPVNDRKDDKRGGFGRDRNRKSGGGGGGGGRGGGGGGGNRRAPPDRRVFISNIPFEMKWQEVKDMFRDEVGDVTYVELFNDESGKARGCGILEFATEELAKKAVEKMHRHELRGRKLVVKEDFDTERDSHGRIITGSRGGRDRDRDRGDRSDRGGSMGGGFSGGNGNTYGLSPQFLESLGIEGSLHNRLFVANLSYSVDEKKLREVFRLAGRVVTAELNRDKDGKSRGHAVVEFDHPVEAVQAISMLNNQNLFDRKMTVRFDKQPGPSPEEMSQLPSRLPEGLTGVGMGLGSGGNPLTDVAKNLPSGGGAVANAPMGGGGMGMGGGGGGMGAGGAGDSGAGNNILGQLGELSALSRLLGSAGGGGGGAGNLLSALASNLTGGGGNTGNAPGGGMQQNPMQPQQQNNMGGGMGPGGPMNNGGGAGMGRPMGGPQMGGGGYNSGGGNGFGGMDDMAPVGRGPPQVSSSTGGNFGGGGGGVPRPSSDTVVVRNLPPDCNWQILREGFAHCGEIKYAEMKDRGTGMIRFMNERDAEKAASMMHNQSIAGRTIEVRII